ncbi:SDR family NAD(P)-dependent oxidoreductase, partial [Streptomyces sp. NPDC052042]|uniref:type I polyketide synthase n=1 Tax=Streptomyces sp. NPDC052042 TaxID=3365683 RepID=UPI0037D978D2
VRFTDTIHTAHQHGTTTYLEIGPHPTLTTLTHHTLNTTNSNSNSNSPTLTHTLHRNHPEPHTLTTAIATLHTHIAEVDATALLPSHTPARRVPLPAYAFQRDRYWIQNSATRTDSEAATRFGLIWQDHPFLNGATPIAGSRSTLLTGRVTLAAHPWLADHIVAGSALFPGTAMADLLLRVADEVGSGGVEEVVLHVPLVLPAQGAVQLQVLVEEPDEHGRRAVTVAARPEAEAGMEAESQWTKHAAGVLAAAEPAGSPAAKPAAPTMGWAGAVWPPPGAEAVDVDDLYAEFAAAGYEYGPAFTGLTGAWSRGDELFADVRLPEAATGAEEGERGFGIHPALFDAVLHPWRAGGPWLKSDPAAADVENTLLPFSWQGLTLYGTGAEVVRVRLAPADGGALSVQVADSEGNPVLALDALLLRRVPSGTLRTVATPMYRVDWQPVDPTGLMDTPRYAVIGPDAEETAAALRALPPEADLTAHADLAALRTVLDAMTPTPTMVVALTPDTPSTALTFTTGTASILDDPVRAAAAHGLSLIQELVEDERLNGTTLAVVTRGAVEAGETDVPDLAGAALWGLLRSAQSEYPGRFVLVDVDGTPESRSALSSALASGEPQLALRTGVMLAPALVPAEPAESTPADFASAGHDKNDAAAATSTGRADGTGHATSTGHADGTVLLTGCTGALGRRVAVHLARRHGVRHMLLVSRRGPHAPESALLERELTELGVNATFVSCDLADPADVRKAVACVPSEHPLSSVVHTAGVLDDGALAGLTPERIDTVLRAKADAVRNLHEATLGHPLRAFVLFSAAAGLLGRPGQASYAAANAVLDAFARHRRVAGLPAVSLAWGLWDGQDGMSGGLDATALRRLRRDGIMPMPANQALELLDQALTAYQDGPALLVPLLLDSVALRRTAAENGPASVPPLLRTLVKSEVRQHRTTAMPVARHESVPSPAARFAALSAEERATALLDLVSEQVAGVLGHSSATQIDPERPFHEVGFDSLAALELRNRLGRLVDLRLPTTLAFDHPTPRRVAEWIDGELPAAMPAAGTPATDPVLTGIDHVAQAVALMDADDGRRDDVRERLIGLLAALDKPAPGSASTPAEATVADRIGEATDDEIFAFLDEHLDEQQ